MKKSEVTNKKLSFDLLSKHREELNRINVFPMADKDTGNNLCTTLSALEEVEYLNLEQFLEEASNKCIMSCRGSSGNILALYILGLSQNYNEDLYLMCSRASKFVWDTMYEPVEGTILTAMKDVPQNYSSKEDFVYQYIQNTINNLMSGPDLLPVLKKNNTLDSGTLGFLYILCGVYETLTGVDLSPEFDLSPVSSTIDNNELTYCVEVLFSNGDFKGLRENLLQVGEEVIIITTSEFTKVHVHTNDYEQVIKICNNYGTVIREKVEDMKNGNKLLKTEGV